MLFACNSWCGLLCRVAARTPHMTPLMLTFCPAARVPPFFLRMNTPVAGPVPQVCQRTARHHQHSWRHSWCAGRDECRILAGCHQQLAAGAVLPNRRMPAVWRAVLHHIRKQRAPALELSSCGIGRQQPLSSGALAQASGRGIGGVCVLLTKGVAAACACL